MLILIWIQQTYPPRLRSKGCCIWQSGQPSGRLNVKLQKPGYLLQPSQSDTIDVFDRPALLEPRRAVRLQPVLRPASRDLSGDARSGNTNQARTPEGRSEEHPNNDHAHKTSFLPTSSPSSISGRLDHPWFHKDWARTSPTIFRPSSTPGSFQTYLLFTM